MGLADNTFGSIRPSVRLSVLPSADNLSTLPKGNITNLKCLYGFATRAPAEQVDNGTLASPSTANSPMKHKINPIYS